MGILHNVMDRLAQVFPLRLNGTVQDLEETLALAQFQESIQRSANVVLKEINEEFLQENLNLSKDLEDAQEEAREERSRANHFQKRIGEILMARDVFDLKPFRWGSEGYVHKGHSFETLAVRLDHLVLYYALSDGDDLNGLAYDEWAATGAEHIAHKAHEAVREEVLKQLSLHKYRRTPSKETI